MTAPTVTLPLVLSASANCSRGDMTALPAGPQSATLARIAAHTHAHATGHPVHVVVVTRETITRGDT